MLNDCNGAGDRIAVDIRLALEKADFAAIDSAWGALIRALVDHDAASPGQTLAWEKGLAEMPQALRCRLPSLDCLHDVALKAWPTVEDQAAM